jgi:[ribosomal protein S5]-alanine N-acetyltransferase
MAEEIVIYETEDVQIRPMDDIAREMSEIWFFDQEICKYNSHGLFSKIRFEKADPKGNILWSVWKITPARPSLAGSVMLQDISWLNRSAEFTCIFDKQYWAKGLATAAIRLLFYHGFYKLGLNKIWLGTAKGNKGMAKVAEKVGMLREGVLKQEVFLDGHFEDVYRYAILERRWYKLHGMIPEELL